MRIFIILMVLFAIAYAPVRWAVTPQMRRYIGPQFIASFVILIFAGSFAPPNGFFLCCLAVMIFLTRGRLDAVCRFILLGALIPSSPYPLILGGTYLINISTLDVLGVGLGLAVMLKPDRTRAPRPRGWTVEDTIALLIFIVLNIGAARLSDGVNGLMRQMLSGSLSLLLPYILMRRHLRSIEEFRVVMGSLAIAAGILSIYAVYEAGNGWSLFAQINSNLGEQNVGLRNVMIRGNTLRASASMQGALMLGGYMSVGWIATLCSRGMMRSRMLWLAGCGLVTLGELAAQSRGSVACIAVAAAVLLAAYGRPALAAFSLAAAGCGGVLLVVAARFSTKISGFLNLDPSRQDEDYDYRQILFRRGMEEAAKHRWLGSDINSVMARLVDIKQGQGIIDFVNTYLYMYLIGGLIGLIPIVMCLAWMIRRSIGLFRRSDSDAVVAVRAFTLAAMVAVLMQLAFMSFIDRMPALFALMLVGTRVFTTSQIRERVARRARPVAARPSRSALQHKVRPTG